MSPPADGVRRRGRGSVPHREVPLKAVLTALCALFLVMTPIAAGHVADAPAGGPEKRLTAHVKTMKHDRHVIRFFQANRWLLSDPRFEKTAQRQLSSHRRHLAVTQKRAKALRRAIAKRKQERRLAIARAQSPRAAICDVFGAFCDQALEVAHCESRFSTAARNGQYLGLFQMGSSERARYGHGSTPLAQAKAAHRYFVASGRDWSPWSCKPW